MVRPADQRLSEVAMAAKVGQADAIGQAAIGQPAAAEQQIDNSEQPHG